MNRLIQLYQKNHSNFKLRIYFPNCKPLSDLLPVEIIEMFDKYNAEDLEKLRFQAKENSQFELYNVLSLILSYKETL